MKKVLITGASGFIGKHLCMKMLNEGFNVVAFGTSTEENFIHAPGITYKYLLLPSHELSESIKIEQPDFIIHAAGRASVPLSMKSPAQDFNAAVPVVFSILEAIRLYSSHTHLFFLSSAAVYGNPSQLPINESRPARPLSPYGYHKLMSEILMEEYRTIYSVKSTSLRIFSCYGNGLERQLVYDSCIKAINHKMVFMGTGRESRDFIHISDLTKALSLLIKHANELPEVINLASGVEVFVEDVVRLVGKEFGVLNPTFDGHTDIGSPANWQADITLLTSYGFKPSISIEEGIAQYVTWFKLNRNAS